MRNSRWLQIKEIFFEAAELMGADREEVLDKRCGHDAELLTEVKELLEEHSDTDRIFDKPVFAVSALFENNGNGLIKRKFGKFRILREIGAGGMGTVFLAERDDDDFDQQVAIKVSRQPFADEISIRRFMSERQILASLNHPFIAKLIDGGICDDGLPFLIMEYIEGLAIGEFTKVNDLTLRQRLDLFLKICEGVSYAHQNLIIHRDIKPANILVTVNGTPKLLDFGLARLLETDSAETISTTATAFRALTPAYASPEQISGDPVSTSADVYSLGVVLYELLTGKRPYSFSNQSYPKIVQTIENSRILPPSEIAGSGDGGKRLNPRQLKGDLDTIVLKSLRRDPKERYDSVEQFANDIRNFLQGLPIRARPASIAYRASKFYQRNKIPVIAGTIVLLSLILGTTVAIRESRIAREQARIATDARKTAEIEYQKAKSEHEKAKKIAEFMENIISFANPGLYAAGSKKRGNARVIDVINELSGRIESEIPDRKDIQAELHHKFAEIYIMRAGNVKNERARADLGRKARVHATRALDLRRSVYGEKHELVAKDMYYLWATSPDPSDTSNPVLLARAIKMMRETNPNNLNLPYMLSDFANRLQLSEDSKTQDLYFNEAKSESDKGPFELAENYYLETLALFRRKYGEDNFVVVSAKCSVAIAMAKRNKRAELEPYRNACMRGFEEADDESKKAAFKTRISMINEALRHPSDKTRP